MSLLWWFRYTLYWIGSEMSKHNPITFHLHPDYYETLRVRAKAQGVSVFTYAQTVLEDHLRASGLKTELPVAVSSAPTPEPEEPEEAIVPDVGIDRLRGNPKQGTVAHATGPLLPMEAPDGSLHGCVYHRIVRPQGYNANNSFGTCTHTQRNGSSCDRTAHLCPLAASR